MGEETPQEKLQRCVARLGELLAPIMNAPRQPHETINGYGLIEDCGHVYLAAGWLSPSDLDDLIIMTKDRQRQIIERNPKRRSEKSPGCSVCSWERHRQRVLNIWEREN